MSTSIEARAKVVTDEHCWTCDSEELMGKMCTDCYLEHKQLFPDGFFCIDGIGGWNGPAKCTSCREVVELWLPFHWFV